MLNIPVHLFRITVIFNPANLLAGLSPVTLVSDDFLIDEELNGRNLSVPQGLSLIVFDLMPLPGGDPLIDPPAFNTTIGPIVFNDPNNPSDQIATPDAFELQTFGAGHCVMLDFNTAKNRNSHQFTVNVLYGGVNYPQDPTIINEPPMPTG